MEQIKWMFIATLLVGCARYNENHLRSIAANYCNKCGGVTSAFMNDHGLNILCKDGNQLEIKTAFSDTAFMVGECR